MISFLSWRYAFSKTAHHRASAIRIMITTSLSLAMVVVVISLMNYMQISRFDNIRDVRSFDLVLDGRHRNEIDDLYPNLTIFEYGEGEALIGGNAYLVRYIDSSYDGGISFIFGDSSSLAIPYSLYIDERETSYDISLLRKGKSNVVLPRTISLPISGVYVSRMGSEFDSSYVFLPIDLSDDTISFKTAIKGGDPKMAEELEKAGYKVTTWQESESSLYSAFIVEKTMMYVVLALLFLIIGVSTKQSVRIFYREKRKERVELEIIGVSRSIVDISFALSFLIVLLFGIAIAFILSLCLLYLIESVGFMAISLSMELQFPILAFIGFSLLLILLTFIFISTEIRRDRGIDFMEVVNGR